MSISPAIGKIITATLNQAFEETYDKWGGAELLDTRIARELLVPVFTGKRLETLIRRVNAIMDRQQDLPLDNVWRVELRENHHVMLTDFTLPSSSTILNKVIPISKAPKFIRDGLAVLQIAREELQVDGVGKRVSDTVYYILEQVDGKHTGEKGEGCS
jgi:hypothetical protein